MQIPGLGNVTADDEYGWLYSEPIEVAALGGETCDIVLEGYEEDANKEDFHAAIQAFLAAGPEMLKAAERHVFRYYQDMIQSWDPQHEAYVVINAPADVWKHVQLGNEPMFSRNHAGDKGVYVSLECNCDWEPEHGLQLVFRNGATICKVGPYDGLLTNANAYADPDLEDVIYRGMARS